VLVRNVRVNSSIMARGYTQMTPAALCREQTNTMGYARFTQLWTVNARR
jgi:hypothetical protein